MSIENDQGRPRPPRPAMQRRTYTLEEVSELLGLSRNATYVAARANALPVPVIRVGKRMFVPRCALDHLLDGIGG